jgi:hypothetical protein
MYLRSYPRAYLEHRLRFSKAKALFTLAPATPDYEVVRLLQRSFLDLLLFPYKHRRALGKREYRNFRVETAYLPSVKERGLVFVPIAEDE